MLRTSHKVRRPENADVRKEKKHMKIVRHTISIKKTLIFTAISLCMSLETFAQFRTRTNDLLSISNPIYLIEAGNWAFLSKTLIADDTAAGRMAFPYYPPAEYNFVVEFMITRSNGNIAFLLSQGSVPFAWSLNTSGGNARLEDYYGHSISGNPNIRYYPLTPYTIYKADMRIRTNSVTCLINDTIVQEEYRTTFSELSRNSKWLMSDNRLLGIGGYSYLINHILSAKVVEISGPGTWITNLYSNYPEPDPGVSPTNSIITLRKALFASYSNLSTGRVYSIQTSENLKTWATMSSFTATNPTMTHTQAWFMDSLSRPASFFRLSDSLAPPAASGW